MVDLAQLAHARLRADGERPDDVVLHVRLRRGAVVHDDVRVARGRRRGVGVVEVRDRVALRRAVRLDAVDEVVRDPRLVARGEVQRARGVRHPPVDRGRLRDGQRRERVRRRGGLRLEREPARALVEALRAVEAGGGADVLRGVERAWRATERVERRDADYAEDSERAEEELAGTKRARGPRSRGKLERAIEFRVVDLERLVACGCHVDLPSGLRCERYVLDQRKARPYGHKSCPVPS